MSTLKKTLVFATNNAHKISEIRQQLCDEFEIITLEEASIFIEIPEPHDTLEKNASEKSRTILSLTGKDCFSEDTGLEVTALNGAPGVRSARYVENNEQFSSNIEKLLFNLASQKNNSAKFRTIISLQMAGKEWFFEGICTGKILHKQRGFNGFGYDSVFLPDGSDKTFAEMTMQEKAIFSHRGKAVKKLAEFLK